MPEPASPDEIVARLLARHPAAPRIFLRHGLHCLGCAIAPFETLADACAAYGIPIAQVIEELDRACLSPGEEDAS